ncbi:PrsW family intramembrane metalloprotease [Candidatus Bathyarchaeota archaeon]|nr:PrsW family intramembrane metalloprotease [Candidatus Bathyarchaeota archaeon]
MVSGTEEQTEKKPSGFALELEGKSSVLHTLDCPEYVEKTLNGTVKEGWHYPFETYEDAFTFGSNLEGRSYPKVCGKCRPWQYAERKTEANSSFTVRDTTIDSCFTCIKSWLIGIGASIQEEHEPRKIKAKTRSQSTYGMEYSRELAEFELDQVRGDTLVKLRLWMESSTSTPYAASLGVMNTRVGQVKKELTEFIKESTKEFDRETVYTIRDAFNNLRKPRPLLARVTDVEGVEESPSRLLTYAALLVAIGLVALYGGLYFGFDLGPFTEHIVELVLTYGAAAALIYWTYLSDKGEREPIVYVVLMFCWGIFSGLIAAQLNSIMGAALPVPAALVAPFVEEPIKALGLYVFLTHPRTRDEFNSPLDGIIYGFAVGMGFYASENFVYYLHYSIGTLLMRILLCWGHGLWVAVVGLWIAVNRHYRGYNVVGDMVPGLSVAIAMHFIWNGLGYLGEFGGRMVLYYAIFQLGYLRKIISEGRRDEMYSGGDRIVFSRLERESADKRSKTRLVLAVILLLSAGSMYVYGSEALKGRSRDWVTYEHMGFTFTVPERLWSEAYGEYEGEEASESYGELWFGNYRGQPRELLIVRYGSYSKLPFWDSGYASDLIGEDIELGGETNFTVNGHRGLYRRFNTSASGDRFHCVVSGWACKDTWRVFYVQYYTVGDDPYETWLRVIESFRCH